jgi:hypothetical protein
MLDINDFQNLLAVVRRSTPTSFDEGKQLVILEGKVLQVLEQHNEAQLQRAIAEANSEDKDGDVPSSD